MFTKFKEWILRKLHIFVEVSSSKLSGLPIWLEKNWKFEPEN